MKNQYFGDVNDYRKYSLLRILAGQSITTAVCWLLTENDTGADGRKVAYLNNSQKWRSFDPELFDRLKSCVHDKRTRNVKCADKIGLIQRAVWTSGRPIIYSAGITVH